MKPKPALNIAAAGMPPVKTNAVAAQQIAYRMGRLE